MRLALLAVCGLLISPTLAAAQTAAPDPTLGDVRCLMVGMAMTNAPDQKVKTAGLMQVYYFLGRIDGRSPKLDVETRIRNEVAGMSRDRMQAESQRCGKHMVTRAQALQAIGKRLGPPAAAPKS